MVREFFLKIGRPRNACISCGAEISGTGSHPSALSYLPDEDDDDAQEPVREDFCGECWSALEEKKFLGFWMARRETPKPDPVKTRKDRNQLLLSYFDSLREQEGEDDRSYVLAHLLMRFQVLKWLRTLPADAETGQPSRIVFRCVPADEEVTVRSVEVSDERSQEILDDIGRLLQRQELSEQPAEGAN